MVANVKVYTTVNLLSNAVAKIEKVDSTDSSIKLQGAKFELFSDSGCTKPVRTVMVMTIFQKQVRMESQPLRGLLPIRIITLKK